VEPEFIEVYGATGWTAFLSGRLFCGLVPQMCLERFGKLSVSCYTKLGIPFNSFWM